MFPAQLFLGMTSSLLAPERTRSLAAECSQIALTKIAMIQQLTRVAREYLADASRRGAARRWDKFRALSCCANVDWVGAAPRHHARRQNWVPMGKDGRIEGVLMQSYRGRELGIRCTRPVDESRSVALGKLAGWQLHWNGWSGRGIRAAVSDNPRCVTRPPD